MSAPDIDPVLSRRAPLHPAIDEPTIERLVRHFYTAIRADPVLGPIFAARIAENAEDWEPHLRTMMAFWSSVTMMTGRYKGTPVAKHQALRDLVAPEHFTRWLDLFRASARTVCPAPVADIFIDRAERIATSLQLAMWGDPALEPRR